MLGPAESLAVSSWVCPSLPERTPRAATRGLSSSRCCCMAAPANRFRHDHLPAHQRRRAPAGLRGKPGVGQCRARQSPVRPSCACRYAPPRRRPGHHRVYLTFAADRAGSLRGTAPQGRLPAPKEHPATPRKSCSGPSHTSRSWGDAGSPGVELTSHQQNRRDRTDVRLQVFGEEGRSG